MPQAALPFVLQGILIVVAEFWGHRRRPVGRWERIGHPVDTLAFLGALAFLLARAPGQAALYEYGALAGFSALVVTKDEWEHRGQCSGFENWLHACLFLLHPTLLIWAGHLWWTGDPRFVTVVGGAAAATGLFALHQIVYWNFVKGRA